MLLGQMGLPGCYPSSPPPSLGQNVQQGSHHRQHPKWNSKPGCGRREFLDIQGQIVGEANAFVQSLDVKFLPNTMLPYVVNGTF